ASPCPPEARTPRPRENSRRFPGPSTTGPAARAACRTPMSTTVPPRSSAAGSPCTPAAGATPPCCCPSFRPPAVAERGSAARRPHALSRGDRVAHELLQLLDVGEPSALTSRPQHLIAGANLEDAALAGDQGDLADLGLEGGEELLGHPGRPEQPAALRAVLDLDSRAAHQP